LKKHDVKVKDAEGKNYRKLDKYVAKKLDLKAPSPLLRAPRKKSGETIPSSSLKKKAASIMKRHRQEESSESESSSDDETPLSKGKGKISPPKSLEDEVLSMKSPDASDDESSQATEERPSLQKAPSLKRATPAKGKLFDDDCRFGNLECGDDTGCSVETGKCVQLSDKVKRFVTDEGKIFVGEEDKLRQFIDSANLKGKFAEASKEEKKKVAELEGPPNYPPPLPPTTEKPTRAIRKLGEGFDRCIATL